MKTALKGTRGFGRGENLEQQGINKQTEAAMRNPLQRSFAFILAIIFFLLVPLYSHAADWWTACTPERERLCRGIEYGGGRIIKCLDEHASELSEACKAAKSAPPSKEASQSTASVAPVTSMPLSHGFVVVDHTNFNAIDNAALPSVEKIGRLSVFFAHASVGGNLVDGIRRLHQQDARRFSIRIEDATGSPPARTESGVIYEFNRGNPGWSTKIQSFEGYVRNGWHGSKAPVVINKFCFIDQNASLDDYIQSMSRLESEHPDTAFIYVTMPITRTADANATRRQAFNDGLRKWARANGKALFDIADIEAWTPSGSQCAGLCAEYTEDNGHLVPKGQLRAARGLYSLFLQLAGG